LGILDTTKISLEKLGEKVRFLRQGKGWSLQELAERSGVSKAYLSDLENGSAGRPNIQYVYAISVALEVTLDQLLQDAAGAKPVKSKKRETEELPPGLKELQTDLNLSDDDVDMLARVNFRGNRPKDKEGWRFLWDTIKLLGQQKPQK
jgi:transcriptional regulator with XRE-family HTH domain